MSGIIDINGKEFTEGCRFIKPVMYGRSAVLEERFATLRDGRVYSRDSKVPIRIPSRCWILDQPK